LSIYLKNFLSKSNGKMEKQAIINFVKKYALKIKKQIYTQKKQFCEVSKKK